MSIKDLHIPLNREGKVSLRAVYKVAEKLLEAGVLIKVRKHLLVDQEWAQRVGERLRPAPIPAPSAGERVVYTFSSVEHLDAFWKTVVLPIEEAAEAREVFFYNPHNFWAYVPGRKESEMAYYQHFSAMQRGFFTIGGETEADKAFKRAFQSEYLQVDTRDIGSLPRTDHVTLMGPLILTVRLRKALAARIDELYASGRPLEEILPAVLALCRAPGKIRFVLENNLAKAKKMRRLLAKNFYFKRE